MAESSAPAVVVGIDGSRSAVEAALWAIPEAASRDIPVRLVYGIDPGAEDSGDRRSAAHALATAELAVRGAFAAVEASEQPVKIEVEILQKKPAKALLEASRSALMICVGAIGLTHALPGGVGSTAASLLGAAHCPVAIIRPGSSLRAPGVVLVEVGESIDSDVTLESGFAEAQLRQAPLHVLQAWQPRFTDPHDPAATVAANNRTVKAQLKRRLARWRRLYPDVAIHAVAVPSNMLGYLAKNARSVQLVVVGAHRSGGAAELVGSAGMSVLHDTGCSLLLCNEHRML